MIPLQYRAISAIFSLIFLCATTQVSRAQEITPDEAPQFRKNVAVRVGLEQLALPGDEAMGMLGTSYLFEMEPNLYAGLAAYSAVTGHRAGFYTVGGELAWKNKLGTDLSLVTGMYVGGGGNNPAIVGGGLMLRPHADLMWNLGAYRAGISVSTVRFPNGNISSNQFGLIAEFDTEFLYTNFKQIGQFSSLKERSGVGFDRVLLVVGAYKPSASSTDLSGVALQRSIGYVGTRMEHLITPNYFWGIETAGAFSGGVPGYAELLGTLGAELPVWDDRMRLGARVALGTGGAGSVMNSGGGALVKAGLYAAANLGRDSHVSVEGGVASAPSGNFRATYGTLALYWDLDHPYGSGASSRIVGNEWVVGTQHYFAAMRKDGNKLDMDVLTIKINRFLTESFYLTGQAHSAYSGYAGGYAAGLVGAGYRTSTNESGLYWGAEMLAGAGAGGWVDTKDGAIVQPMTYVGMALSQAVSARLGVGRVKSVQGTLSSSILDFGLSFAFGTGNRD